MLLADCLSVGCSFCCWLIIGLVVAGCCCSRFCDNSLWQGVPIFLPGTTQGSANTTTNSRTIKMEMTLLFVVVIVCWLLLFPSLVVVIVCWLVIVIVCWLLSLFVGCYCHCLLVVVISINQQTPNKQ